jgi:hypothetical protein
VGAPTQAPHASAERFLAWKIGWKHENNSLTGRNQRIQIIDWFGAGGNAGSDFWSPYEQSYINRALAQSRLSIEQVGSFSLSGCDFYTLAVSG